jgi:rubrerythrin
MASIEVAMAATHVSVGNGVTIKNLLAAFEGESNAHAKYTAYAVKADEDGVHGAASIFRAAALAEQIHAANHARVIRKLGGEAAAEIFPVEVGSTLENLKSARDGEEHEIKFMYPEFLEEARARINTAAVRTFEWALEAEKTHARLYREAIQLLESAAKDTWLDEAREFYVCTTCGYTSETLEADRCPVCNLAWEKFELVG